MAQTVKNLPVMWEIWVQFLGQQDPLEKDRLPTPGFMGFPGGLGGKESACNVGDLDLIKTMVFSVVMYGFESWTIKKAEH